MSDPVTQERPIQEQPRPRWPLILGSIVGGFLLVAVGLGLGWYLFYRPIVNVTVMPPPTPPAPVAKGPDPAALKALDDQIAAQEKANKDLEARILALKERLRGDVCTLQEPRGLPPSGTAPVSPAPQQRGDVGKGAAITPAAAVRASVSVAELAPRLEQSVVFVVASAEIGSGFFIGPDLVVTNRHVVDQTFEGNKVVITSRHLGRARAGTVIAATPRQGAIGGPDFAVIRLDDGPAHEITPLALAPEPKPLQEVVAAGYPGLALSNDRNFRRLLEGDIKAAPDVIMTRGEVNAVQNVDRMPAIVHTATISSGNSGGPLIDRCARAVGINSFVGADAREVAKTNFAIGATALAAFLRQSNIAFEWQTQPCLPA